MHVDNVGAILIRDNILVFQRANNIDIRHHLIWDYVEDRTVKKNRPEENIADPFTKNLSNGLFEFITSMHVHCE